jgi:hypothetical protein
MIKDQVVGAQHNTYKDSMVKISKDFFTRSAY